MHSERAGEASEADRLAREIRNTDIQWDGTYVGLMPRLATERANRLLTLGEAAIPSLLAALDDAERFAAAHVLLTRISGVEFEAGAGQYNGLRVELLANGAAKLDPAQRAELAARWRKWSVATPRMPRLPPP